MFPHGNIFMRLWLEGEDDVFGADVYGKVNMLNNTLRENQIKFN